MYICVPAFTPDHLTTLKDFRPRCSGLLAQFTDKSHAAHWSASICEVVILVAGDDGDDLAYSAPKQAII